jgi:hypothetical protein
VPRLVPLLRLASVVASLLLVITFATNFVVPLSASRVAEPMYGIGGAGGGGANDSAPLVAEAPAATEEMLLAPAATSEPDSTVPGEPAPTDSPLPAEEPSLKSVEPQGTEGLTPEAPPPDVPPAGLVSPPISSGWQIGLLAAALTLAALAFLLRWLTDRRWQRKH